MIITKIMIRELQRRVDISYEDAEKYLRRAGGNIDIAESYANRKANSFGNRLFREFEKIINATLIYRVKVFKGNDHLVNIPILGFLIIFFLVGLDKFLLLGVVFIILALLADCNLQIYKVENQNEFRFYNTVNKKEAKKSEVNKSYADKTKSSSYETREAMINNTNTNTNINTNNTNNTKNTNNTQTNNTIQDSYDEHVDDVDNNQRIVDTNITPKSDVIKDNQQSQDNTFENTYLDNDNDDDYYEVTIDK